MTESLTDTGLCEAVRATRILALEFVSKMRSGVKRGAERDVHERDTQSCGELFFGPVSVKLSKSNNFFFIKTSTK